ncbi:MAG TPA: efflux RND transporter periplasmic adaptor subunit [Candidatus Acidoferrum sp.]|nr:efflux RND transporter periplasmic adaptor subunit [Candidatus Acidoferrum sp.]
MPPPQVAVVPVQQQEIVEWEEFTGRTAPVDYVEVRPRVSGHIDAVKFQSGQLVKKGDVLFQIDARWHKAEFDRRAAEYESAKVKLANADREARRTTQLLANKAISTEEGDQRQARFEEARAMLLAAQAARDAAQLDLEYTTVRSAIDGRVSREMVTVGNYVSGTAGNATLLTTIVSIDPIHVYADVDENSLLKFNALASAGKLAQNSEGRIPVELQLADEGTFPHRGYIESFDNKLDPQTGSILLRTVFPNADGRIVPGLFARIRVPASEKHPAVLIEETAIGTDQAQKFVLTLTSSNTVAYRPVKLGPQVSGKRLVREGLQPGEQVVQNLVMARVRPGMPVQPQQSAAETNNGAVQTAQR